jgi:hypothetical protein
VRCTQKNVQFDSLHASLYKIQRNRVNVLTRFTSVRTYDDNLRTNVSALDAEIYILEEAPATTLKSILCVHYVTASGNTR